MKITNVRARTFEWKGKTVPPQGNFCSNAIDLLYSTQETMSTVRFHGWTLPGLGLTLKTEYLDQFDILE